MLKHLDQRRRDDEGFTLIELMVVVLILGILMAIAIPTFLSTTKSAKGVAGESNATNAATSEISNYSTSQAFLSSASGGTTLDPAIPWDTTGTDTVAASGTVLVVTSTATGDLSTLAVANTSGDAMVLESTSSDGACYAVVDDQSLTTPMIGYVVFAGGCPSALPTADPGGTAPPASGSANATGNVIPAGATPNDASWPADWDNYYSNF